MSATNPLGGGGDPLQLPGHLISPGDLGQKFEFATFLAALYVRRAYLAAEGLSPESAGRLIARADAVVMAGAFNVGGRFFLDGVSNPDLVPALLWCNLRVTEPSVTLAECARLVTEQNHRSVKLALWRAWGYGVASPKAIAPETGQHPEA